MAKGGSFENEVCKVLSLWISQSERDDIFRRSVSSGAQFTQRRKSNKDTAYQGADITFADPIGEPLIKKWSIECKTGYGGKSKKTIKGTDVSYIEEKRWDVLDFLDSKQKEPTLQKMWNQCKRDAELTLRRPVLIFRRNHREKCVVVEQSYFIFLRDYFGKEPNRLQISLKHDVLCVFSLEDFLNWAEDISCILYT